MPNDNKPCKFSWRVTIKDHKKQNKNLSTQDIIADGGGNTYWTSGGRKQLQSQPNLPKLLSILATFYPCTYENQQLQQEQHEQLEQRFSFLNPNAKETR